MSSLAQDPQDADLCLVLVIRKAPFAYMEILFVELPSIA